MDDLRQQLALACGREGTAPGWVSSGTAAGKSGLDRVAHGAFLSLGTLPWLPPPNPGAVADTDGQLLAAGATSRTPPTTRRDVASRLLDVMVALAVCHNVPRARRGGGGDRARWRRSPRRGTARRCGGHQVTPVVQADGTDALAGESAAAVTYQAASPDEVCADDTTHALSVGGAVAMRA